MAVANAAAWVLWSRWERPGYGVELRARLRPPLLIRRGGDLVQVAPLVYPVLVVVAPAWAYEGRLNWSSEIDPALQAAGLGLWLAFELSLELSLEPVRGPSFSFMEVVLSDTNM
jgi:hypothetical protein